MNDGGELYELVGYGWRLPIWAKLVEKDLFEVQLADVPSLRKQREAAEAGLRTFCQTREGDVWYFTRKGLEQSALKSQFTDPEDVVVWKHPEAESAAPSDFVHAYCRSRDCIPLPQFQNPATFGLIWSSICKVMLDFLLVQGGEVDLGFAKLSAVCARANWKSVIIGRIVARRRNGLSKDTEATRREIRKLLHRDIITACSNGQTVRWALEIEPQKSFHDGAAEVIELRRKREQRGSYAFNVLKLLKSNTHKNKMHRLLESHWRETQIPCARLPHGFQPRPADDQNGLEVQPAPKLTPTAIVDGTSMKEKNGFVSLVNADALTDEDRARLSGGLPPAMAKMGSPIIIGEPNGHASNIAEGKART